MVIQIERFHSLAIFWNEIPLHLLPNIRHPACGISYVIYTIPFLHSILVRKNVIHVCTPPILEVHQRDHIKIYQKYYHHGLRKLEPIKEKSKFGKDEV